MSTNQKGNAGVTILVIVVILIIAGVLFFRNSADAPVTVDETASTTEETTMTETAPVMEDGAVQGASTEAAPAAEVVAETEVEVQ